MYCDECKDQAYAALDELTRQRDATLKALHDEMDVAFARKTVADNLQVQLDAALLQVGEMLKLLKRAEDALGPDRTATDRKDALLLLGKYIVDNRKAIEKPKCEPNAKICHETVRFDGGPIYCYQPMPCRVHGVEKRVEEPQKFEEEPCPRCSYSREKGHICTKCGFLR
jgi:hypothetical protein